MLRDYDNDGKADFLTIACEWEYDIAQRAGRCRPVGTTKVYALQFGATANSLALNTTFGVKFSPIIGDFNGDGLPDFFNATSLYASNPGVASPNLMTKIVNEFGGEFWPEYTPSSHWQNGYMPQVLHAVTRLWVGDGRGSAWSITDYAYSGGKYDPKARKFLGYEKIIETKPLAEGETEAERPTVETTYRQDVASYGLPELTVYRDGSGAVKKQVDETWSVNTSAKPYWAKNTQTDTTFSEGQTLILRITRTFRYMGQQDPRIRLWSHRRHWRRASDDMGLHAQPRSLHYRTALHRGALASDGDGGTQGCIFL